MRSEYQHMLDVQEKISETCRIAQEELEKNQKKNEKYYNRTARLRTLQIGDRVKVLLPIKRNKMLLKWRGPYEVVDRIGELDYRVKLDDGRLKTYHINMLKKDVNREEGDIDTTECQTLATVVTVVNDGEIGYEEEMLELFNGKQKETHKDVLINPELSERKRKQVVGLLEEYSDIFSDVPGKTNLAEHEIKLTSDKPVRSKPYPTPYNLQKEINKEIDTMLESGIIERSDSAYAAPLVVVKKADGSNRICCNYKQLNKLTIFDPEPMMSKEDVFNKLSGSQLYSKFDFCKGYWQIPMKDECKDMTTFVCNRGLFRFTVMPFGLVNSASSYNRMMRKLIDGIQQMESYVDDVLAHTQSWEDHLEGLGQFFERVRRANLTLKPKKCQIGFSSVDFLGHTVSNNRISPKEEAVEKIVELPRPKTKKQIRSFLGAINYYRDFIPECGKITQPLTELTKKSAKNVVDWNPKLEKAFQELKCALSKEPVLKLPNMEEEFILRTDASGTAVGCVLMQEEHGVKHPVSYISRELSDRERKYSVEERECLAIVWGIQKLNRYLYGRTFTVETYHCGLQYLKTGKVRNPRVTLWNLAMQNYSFRIKYIRGEENVMADYLSRAIE